MADSNPIPLPHVAAGSGEAPRQRQHALRRTVVLRTRADERWQGFTATATAALPTLEPVSEEELVRLSGAFRADA